MDLAGYDFVNGLSTALLDQVAIDGGIYALPVNNAMYGIYYNKALMEEQLGAARQLRRAGSLVR